MRLCPELWESQYQSDGKRIIFFLWHILVAINPVKLITISPGAISEVDDFKSHYLTSCRKWADSAIRYFIIRNRETNIFLSLSENFSQTFSGIDEIRNQTVYLLMSRDDSSCNAVLPWYCRFCSNHVLTTYSLLFTINIFSSFQPRGFQYFITKAQISNVCL